MKRNEELIKSPKSQQKIIHATSINSFTKSKNSNNIHICNTGSQFIYLSLAARSFCCTKSVCHSQTNMKKKSMQDNYLLQEYAKNGSKKPRMKQKNDRETRTLEETKIATNECKCDWWQVCLRIKRCLRLLNATGEAYKRRQCFLQIIFAIYGLLMKISILCRCIWVFIEFIIQRHQIVFTTLSSAHVRQPKPNGKYLNTAYRIFLNPRSYIFYISNGWFYKTVDILR